MKNILSVLFVVAIFETTGQSKGGYYYHFYDSVQPKGGYYYRLDSAVQNSDKVKRLMLNSQNIIQLPVEIVNMQNLRKINLEFNKQLDLIDLCTKLSSLKRLKELDLAHCSINELPKEIGLLKNLNVLEIGANNFKSLPDEIKSLQNLRELIFTQGSYESFYSLPLEAKKDLIRSLPKCKILLRENRPKGQVHGEYTLGKKSVRVTLNNVNLFTNRSSFLDSH